MTKEKIAKARGHILHQYMTSFFLFLLALGTSDNAKTRKKYAQLLDLRVSGFAITYNAFKEGIFPFEGNMEHKNTPPPETLRRRAYALPWQCHGEQRKR